MSASPTDIATLLRQKQLMDQLNQTTSQGTQRDILQPGLQAFDDTAGGTQTSPTGVQQYPRARGLTQQPQGTQDQSLIARTPVLGNIQRASQNLSNAITGLTNRTGLTNVPQPQSSAAPPVAPTVAPQPIPNATPIVDPSTGAMSAPAGGRIMLNKGGGGVSIVPDASQTGTAVNQLPPQLQNAVPQNNWGYNPNNPNRLYNPSQLTSGQ